MTSNRIPGGITDSSTEFFTVNGNEPMCFYSGQLFSGDSIPTSRLSLIYTDVKSKSVVHASLVEMVGNDEAAIVKQALICRYAQLDGTPDITADGKVTEAEFVPCQNRGNCKFEGKACCSIMVKDNTYLSKAETEVFIRVQMPDKNIASELFISDKTVKKHFQNIRLKTGLNTKIEMAAWAAHKGII